MEAFFLRRDYPDTMGLEGGVLQKPMEIFGTMEKLYISSIMWSLIFQK